MTAIAVYIFMYLAVSILLAAIDSYDELIERNAVVSYISYDRYGIFRTVSQEGIEDTVGSVVSVAKYDNGIIWAIVAGANFGSGCKCKRFSNHCIVCISQISSSIEA